MSRCALAWLIMACSSLVLLAQGLPAQEAGEFVNLSRHEAQDRYPAWSPDGKHIAFESDRGDSWSLYRMAPDGSGQERLTDGDGNDRFPAWDPSGSKLVFQSDRSGSAELHVLDVASGEVRRLTKLDGTELFPSWRPDGETIAFSLRREDSIAIYRIPAAGGDAEVLITGEHPHLWPRWSPDGKTLMFFSRRDTEGENDEVYLLDLASKKLQRLTHRPGHDFCPQWSPAGDRLAVAASRPENQRSIEILDLEGQVLKQAGLGFLRITEPSWSPDGKRLAVAGRRSESEAYEIFVVPAPGS